MTLLSRLQSPLQARRCRKGHHRPLVWASSPGIGVQIDWARYYSLTDVRVIGSCPACHAQTDVPVTSWDPIEKMEIPNMCPKCHLVHDSEVRCW